MSKNSDDYYSASEINKFTYCNYAWYYQKKKFKVEIDKKLKNSATKKNFKRGIKFHKKYYERKKYIALIKRCCFIILIIAILILSIKVFGGNIYELFSIYYG